MAPERLITHRFPLREVRRAAATANDSAVHRSVKIVLDNRDPMEPQVEGLNMLVEQGVGG